MSKEKKSLAASLAPAIVGPVPTPNLSIEAIITTAVQSNAPVETMERLLAMRRELKTEWAKEQYDRAMAEFQSECPVIEKKKDGGKTNSGAVAYRYAPLEDIVAQVKGLLQKHGFSYSFDTITKENMVTALCISKHEAGHSERSSFEVPLGTKTQIMSATQQTAAAITYAKRYAFCNAFGILTGDEDTDAAPPPSRPPRVSYSVPRAMPVEDDEPGSRVPPPEEKSKKEQIKDLVKKAGKIPTPRQVEQMTGLKFEEENYELIIERLEAFHD